MDLTLYFVAAALAMDRLAVSAIGELTKVKPKATGALRIAGSFGSFQSLMTLLRWLAGNNFIEAISGVDHWVAFGLLASVGAKTICESIKKKARLLSLDVYSLLVMSLATSIDALATGLCLTITGGYIFSSTVVIGVVSFVLSLFGFYTGNRVGKFTGGKAEAVGGLILIAIGAKTLLEHL